jgi:hypothetical protein
MRVGEAKDFLVQQTADQAQREGIALSDLEKRMMYFTEGPDATENPISLNEEFEAQYNTAEYETKIARLMDHAYRRLKKESPEVAPTWDAAIRELRKGDHYILMMCGRGASVERPPLDFLRLVGWSFVAAVGFIAIVCAGAIVTEHYNIHWNPNWAWGSNPHTHASLSVWLQRLLLALILGGYVYYAVLPLFWRKLPLATAETVMFWRKREKNDLRTR